MALANTGSIGRQATRGEILDLDAADVTPSRGLLSVQLERDTDPLYMLGLLRRLAADDFTVVGTSGVAR